MEAARWPLAPVTIRADHQLIGQGRARRWRGIGPDRDRLGDALRDLVTAVVRRHHDLIFPRALERALQARMQACALQVVEYLLGLVLEAQDDHVGTGLDVRQ